MAHRLIIAVAAENKLPAVYSRRYYIERGGLVSYGYDVIQQYRSTAGYVDRSLKGEKPADLPVQAPTKYELVINLKPLRLSASQFRHHSRRRDDRRVEPLAARSGST